MKVGDQKALHMQQMDVAAKSRDLLRKDVDTFQTAFESQIMEEKELYLRRLEKLEEATAQDATRRIFSVVEELGEVQRLETAFLDEQIKRRGEQM